MIINKISIFSLKKSQSIRSIKFFTLEIIDKKPLDVTNYKLP